jgi:putative ABC transport system permease protein
MKSYSSLAGRYLRQQRRKSILTIVGIILSVALISALGTMGQALKDNVLANAIYNSGSFHFSYKQANTELYSKLKDHVLVDQLGALHVGVRTKLTNGNEFEVDQADANGFALLPLHLQEGRFPTTPDELVLEAWLLGQLPGKPKLGGFTELADPYGDKHHYKIVGILKNQRQSQMQGQARAFTFMTAESLAAAMSSDTRLFLTLKPGVDISNQIETFSALQPDGFDTNRDILTYMGESSDSGLNRALSIIFGTLVGLVVLSTVAVIYNSFHIAVLERIRQFGLLRTLGATPSQIRNLVIREASTLAVIGIPVGLLVGWGGLWLTLWLMTASGFQIMQMEDFHLTVHWWIMGGSLLIGLAAVYLAAWLPARKASRVSPVDAVKGAGSIVRESYRRTRMPSLLSLMGIEGAMASKNIRRNRAKFRVTTFSIVVSVMLFIVFHYFTQEAFKLTTTTNENDRIAFELHQRMIIEHDGNVHKIQKDMLSPEAVQELAGMPGVHGVYGQYQWPNASALVPEDKLNKSFEQKAEIRFTDKSWNGMQNNIVYTQLTLYDNARLKEAAKYLTAGTADPAKLAAQDGVLLVQTVKPINRTAKKREQMDLTHYKLGDKLTLFMGNNDNPSKDTVREVTVAGILSQSPFNAPYQENALTVMAVKSTFSKLLEAVPAGEKSADSGTAMIGLEVALEDGADPAPVKQKLEDLSASLKGSQLMDIAGEQKQARQFAVQMQIFVYGFLAVIGLIGSLNIINTVQTNLLLRRREIGLLQAVGMSMGQIRKMASAEGVWFGVIGSFWGLILGAGVSYFLYKQLSDVQGVPFVFPWGGATIACAFALAVGLLSVQGPLRRMGKANVIEELREET